MGGYVYLICDAANNTYKIGVTKNLAQQRLKKLQTGNSTELFITKTFFCEYPYRLEKMLHNKFSVKRELNEWFNLDFEDVRDFEQICENLNGVIKSLSDNPFFMKNIR